MMSTETLLEQKLLHSHKKEMIVFLKKHPEYFDEAVELAIQNKQPYSWRAAWVLWSYISKNDIRIKNHIPKLIKAIRNKADGHQRELLKILLEMNLNEEEEGYLFDLCVTLWEDVEKKPSIRYTAFKFIIKMAKKHPELSNEILLLAQDKYLNSLSPGVHRSIKKMITNTIALNHNKSQQSLT
ncbi:MAG: hypothetical protein HKO75_01015 [Flavobacteriaceae bacterium]|nr:hypothetical protein [Muriicola sp.]NNC62479.1 hypothetical protein [Eudoraea sp.]NNL38416.1 hypothetical protein [Flavobacteriaceae bacterium]